MGPALADCFLLVFVSKVLLAPGHVHSFPFVCGCFCVATAELGSFDRDLMGCEAEHTYCLALLQNRFSDPRWGCPVHTSQIRRPRLGLRYLPNAPLYLVFVQSLQVPSLCPSHPLRACSKPLSSLVCRGRGLGQGQVLGLF